MPTPTVWAVPSIPSARIPFGIAIRAKAFGLPRDLITHAAMLRADGPPGSGTAAVRVSSDPRESDDRGGPVARPRRHVPDRTDRGEPGRPVAPGGTVFPPAGRRPRRDGRLQAESDLRVRGRHRDLAPPLAADSRRTPLLSLVGDPGHLSAQLRGRRLVPLPVRV